MPKIIDLSKNIFFLFIIFFINKFSFGQTSNSKTDSIENQLEEVMITGTKTLRVVSSLPLNASVIKKEEIEKTNATRLSDIINEELGLITISDFGGAEGIQMQGLDSEYTLVLIDNQPLVGRSAGSLDLDRISVGNIKQIEIVRGPSSSLYGNEALAGVINIISDEPKKGLNGKISSSYETHNTIDSNFFLSFMDEKFKSSIFLNRYSSDGYDLNNNDELKTVNEFKNFTSQLKLGYTFNDKFNIALNFRNYTQTIDNIASSTLSGESFTSEDNLNIIFSYKSNKIKTD